MQKAGRVFLTACLALLLLLGASRLVEGPESARAAKPPLPLPTDLCLTAAIVPADLPSGEAANAPEQLLRRYAAGEIVRDAVPSLVPLCESNGYPLTGLAWHEAVYAACPPEEKAG